MNSAKKQRSKKIVWSVLFTLGVTLSPQISVAKEEKIIKDCDTCPQLRFIAGGEHTIGATEYEKYPRRKDKRIIALRDYYIGIYEVTLGEYWSCVDADMCDAPDVEFDLKTRVNQPVMAVSWRDAVRYTEYLAEVTGRHYRLLSEVEWEFAAAAGTTTLYWWGNEPSTQHMNYASKPSKVLMRPLNTKWGEPADVGSYPPNPWGLFDMNGNAAEWVADCDDQQRKIKRDTSVLPLYPADGSPIPPFDNQVCAMRVVRGGSYLNADYYARNRFSFAFFDGDSEVSARGLGFRIAAEPSQE